MASDGEELVKYITEKVVGYMEIPREDRRSGRSGRQPWSQRWFGMVPLGFSIWRSGRRHRGDRDHRE
ncbi:YqzE family protein [Paenibacillus sp. HN-1]|uniref:YqzE family protein n=1 Tax=Paenibacillus TaxID=44249 RepID=UPI001CA993AC|nr:MULTISPECIES: YqzE family protein [Paenibacillus]MBY9082439.1 YqzE family protein [Paenibacillus sp. CGMCC 1.18879]MBY9084798.1 YqzE family protein [Paenibacillus sinensis]